MRLSQENFTFMAGVSQHVVVGGTEKVVNELRTRLIARYEARLRRQLAQAAWWKRWAIRWRIQRKVRRALNMRVSRKAL